jgi:hypothetical protein
MLYEIKDALLDTGIIYIKAIALFDKEGLIVEIKTANLPKGIQLVAAYGGATGKKFSRDGDIGADPESSFYLKPEYCTDNIFTIQQNAFQLHYAFPQALSTEERVHIQLQTTSNDEKSKYLEKSKTIKGIFPSIANLKVCDANVQQSPKQLLESNQSSDAPLIAATIDLQSTETYCFLLQQPDKNNSLSYTDLPNLLNQAESTRKALTQTITLEDVNVGIMLARKAAENATALASNYGGESAPDRDAKRILRALQKHGPLTKRDLSRTATLTGKRFAEALGGLIAAQNVVLTMDKIAIS